MCPKSLVITVVPPPFHPTEVYEKMDNGFNIRYSKKFNKILYFYYPNKLFTFSFSLEILCFGAITSAGLKTPFLFFPKDRKVSKISQTMKCLNTLRLKFLDLFHC